MQVARLTSAARRRSDRPFRISPLTIYEANFRQKLTNNFQFQFGPAEKLTNNFQFQFGPAENQHEPCLSDIEDVQGGMRPKAFLPQCVVVECELECHGQERKHGGNSQEIRKAGRGADV